MKNRDSYLNRIGGLRIYWQAWLPEHPPAAVIAPVPDRGQHHARRPHRLA